jgi:membrane protease YdiL (CAAX protease family)
VETQNWAVETLTPPPQHAASSRIGPGTFVWLAGALAFSTSVVVAARVWFDTLQRVWPTSNPTLEGVQFGSFLLVVGGLLAWWWGGDAGFRLGATLREWPIVVSTAAVLAVTTMAFVLMTGSNPYSGADPLFEIVLVPVGEELVFRGLLLGWLLSKLSERHAPRTAARLAIVFSAVAFGSAHASNVLFGVGDFTVVQVLAATVLGMVFGVLRVRTASLAAPIALHALVNGLNLLA